MDQTKVIYEFINEFKNCEEKLLQYLEEDDPNDKNLNDFITYVRYQSILEDKNEFYILLGLISDISNNHYQLPNFNNKIRKLLSLIQKDISKFFTNLEIFDIFKYNKRIILFLLENKIMIPDKSIADIIITNDILKKQFYPEFFYPEFKSFISSTYEQWFEKDSDNFYLNRKLGVNGSILCQLIQKDLIDEFIIYINQKNISFSSKIVSSIYETDPFLLDSEPTLIEYAAFCGSIRIFKYLLTKDIIINNSIWLYAIHSYNVELFTILEYNQIDIENYSVEIGIKESVKCHHNSITNYFSEVYLKVDDIINNYSILKQAISSYNFDELSSILCDESFDLFDWSIIDKASNSQNENIFYDFCIYGYNKMVDFLIKNTNVNFKEIVGPWFTTTPLILAIEKSNINIVKLLLSYPNIDVNFKYDSRRDKRTPLNTAVLLNNIEITKLLLSHPDIDVNEALYRVDFGGNIKLKTPLIIAVEKNNLEMINLLLSHPNIDVNKRVQYYDTYETALSLATKNEYIEIIKVLVSHPKIDVNLPSFKHNIYITLDDETPLEIAVRKNNIDIIKVLLEHPKIDANPMPSIYGRGETPLNVAIKNENIEIVKILLDFPNINVNSKSFINGVKETALNLAVKKNNIEIVKLLLNNQNIDINLKSKFINKYNMNQKETALEIAIKNNDNEIVKLLLNHEKIDINHEENCYEFESPLNLAIKNNNNEIISLLLSKPNIDINSLSRINNRIETSLGIAVKNNNIEIVKLLLSNENINVNRFPPKLKYKNGTSFLSDNNHYSPLSIAVKNGNYEITEMLLLNPKIDVNAKQMRENMIKETALHIAIKSNNNRIIKLLLNHPKIDVNCASTISMGNDIDEEVEPPLNVAIKNENIEIVKLLLDFPDLDVNLESITKYTKETALNLAVKKNNIEIVKLLLNNQNIDINLKSKFINEYNMTQKETALEIAIKNNDNEIAKVLLNHEKIDINHEENCYEFESPLNLAIKNNNNEIISLLLSKPNIDINSLSKINNRIETSLGISIQNNNNEIAKFLLNNKEIEINLEDNQYDFESPLNIAIKNDNHEIISLLINNPNININSISRINRKEETAIYIAFIKKNLEIFHFLLSQPKINLNYVPPKNVKNSIDFIQRYKTPFYYIYLTNPDVKGYISSDAKQFLNGCETLLCLAVKNNDIQTVKILLSNPNIDVNIKSIYFDPDNIIIEKSALNIAIEQENIEIIQLLLSNPNIDVNSALISYQINEKYDFTEDEKYPIHIAVEKKNSDILNLLLSNPKIDINSKRSYFSGKYDDKTYSDDTALSIAVNNEDIEIIKILIKIPELNVNAKIKRGIEFIRFIDGRGENDDLSTFIEKESKVVHRLKSILTALGLAKDKDNLEIIEILSSRKDIDNNFTEKYFIDETYYSNIDRIGVLFYFSNDKEEYIRKKKFYTLNKLADL